MPAVSQRVANPRGGLFGEPTRCGETLRDRAETRQPGPTRATAPLCSPSRDSLFTARYPQSDGLVELAHHGWEYRTGIRTLPHLLSEAGWYTALFGMQHETSHPLRLGFDEFDVSNSYCEYFVDQAPHWLTDPPAQPFLLTAGSLRAAPSLTLGRELRTIVFVTVILNALPCRVIRMQLVHAYVVPSNGLPGARVATQRQHAVGRLATGDRCSGRAAGVLLVPAHHEHVAATTSVVRRCGGRVDSSPARVWRDYIQTVGRTPDGIWGRQVDVESDTAAANVWRACGDLEGDGLLASIRAVGSDPVLVYVHHPDVVSQAVSFSRAEYHAGAIAHAVTMLREHERAGPAGSTRSATGYRPELTSPVRQRISAGTGRTSCRPIALGRPRRASGSAPRGTAATVSRRAGSSPASALFR